MAHQTLISMATKHIFFLEVGENDNRVHVDLDQQVSVELRRRDPTGKANLWAVMVDGLVLNLNGELESEPSPSNRSNDFLSKTRFPLLKAFRVAEDYIEKHILREKNEQ